MIFEKNQITLLMSYALKVMDSLETKNLTLDKIYKGVPDKATKTPTGKIILSAFEDPIFSWDLEGKCHINLISRTARLLLTYLGLSENYYEELVQKCNK